MSRKTPLPALLPLLLAVLLCLPALGCKKPSPPAAAETRPALRLDLAYLTGKQGQPLPRPEARAGGALVLGGYLRGLTPAARGGASFWLSFEARRGERVLSRFRGPVEAPFDLPEEHALRVDLGVPIPADVAPGPGTFHVQIEQDGQPAASGEFPFTVR